jgi:putative phosphoesterase
MAPTKAPRSRKTRWRVAVLSDTHGHLDPRVADVVRECDLAVHAGDIGGPGVLRAMHPLAGRIVAVRGNNDTLREWGAAGRSALGALPEETQLKLPGGTVVVVHGDRVTPAATRHARLRRCYPEARAIVYGHSHRLVCDCEELPWVLNPGAAGRARTFGGPSCLVLDVQRDAWRVRVVRFPPPSRRNPFP